MALEQGAKVSMDFSGVNRRFSNANLARAKFALGNQMLADMNNYVPLDQGSLRNSGHLSSDGGALLWRTVYAKAQFYGSRPWRRGMPVNVFMNIYTTEGTGKRWDLAAKERHLQDWRRAWAKGAGF
ncbi:MAG: minor capsid protein [Turicibacter sp.]|nr:minor capsid protein [Turicibacter sp.]